MDTTEQDSWTGREEERGGGNQSAAGNRHAVETRLRDLRNRHRLAIHVWEQHDPFKFPQFSWDAFNSVAAEAIDAKLQSGRIPLISMSLLPSGLAGVAMKPFATGSDMPGYFSYLVDLEQDKPNPARVVKVKCGILQSGNTLEDKNLHLAQDCKVPELNSFYAGIRSREMALRMAGGEDAKQHTEFQLNMLGRHYEKAEIPPDVYLHNNMNVVGCNEVVASAGREHILAIAVPFFATRNAPATYLPAVKLLGAIAGLEHISHKNADIPVVFYRVSSPRENPAGPDCSLGDCSYIGQGKQELTQVALDAIKELQRVFKESETAKVGYIPSVREKAMRVLGVDIYKDLEMQGAAVDRLCRPQGTHRSAG